MFPQHTVKGAVPSTPLGHEGRHSVQLQPEWESDGEREKMEEENNEKVKRAEMEEDVERREKEKEDTG